MEWAPHAFSLHLQKPWSKVSPHCTFRDVVCHTQVAVYKAIGSLSIAQHTATSPHQTRSR